MVGTKTTNMLYMTGKAPMKEINQTDSVFYGSAVPDFSKTTNAKGAIRPSSANKKQ